MKQPSLFQQNFTHQLSLHQIKSGELLASNNLNRTAGNHRKIFNPQPHSLSKRISLNANSIQQNKYKMQNHSSFTQNLSAVTIKQPRQNQPQFTHILNRNNKGQNEQYKRQNRAQSIEKNTHNVDFNKKHMAFMREQIEISCKFYTEKMNKQIIAQTMQIIQLKNKLSKNQDELKSKQQKIAQLELIPLDNLSSITKNQSKLINKNRVSKEGYISLNRKQKSELSPDRNLSTTPNKKKISITGKDKKQGNQTYTQNFTNRGIKRQQYAFGSPHSQTKNHQQIIQKLKLKISSLQTELQRVNIFQKQIFDSERQIQKKIELIDNGTIKIISFKFKSCERKLKDFFDAHNSRILRIQASIQKMVSNFSANKSTLEAKQSKKNSIFEQNNSQLLFIKDIKCFEQALNPIKSQIEDLRQKTKVFLQKQFKYDNYQLNQLLVQISKIKGQIIQLEQIKQIVSRKIALIIKESASMSQKMRQISVKDNREYSEFLKNKEDFQMFKLCRTQSLQMKEMQNMDLYRINSNQIIKTKRCVEAHSKYEKRDIMLDASKFLSTQQIKQTNQNIFKQNISTPEVKRRISDNQTQYQQLASKQNASKITQQTKYESGHRIRTQNCLEKTNKNETIPRKHYNQEGHSEVQSVQSHEQNFTNQQSSQDQFYYENQEQESHHEQCHEERLIQVIRNMKVMLPLQVQVDQTGYLKSVKSGMYIVDANNDGFELSNSQIHSLIQRGVIFI